MSSGWRAGRNQRLTTSFSAKRHRIGVTDIGRKLLNDFGMGTLGIGETMEASH